MVFAVFFGGLTGCGAVVFSKDPGNLPLHLWIFWYACVACVGFGAAYGIGTLVGRLILRKSLLFSRSRVMFRQAFFIGITSAAALYIQSLRLLNVFSLVLLVSAFALLEFFFLNRETV